MNTITQESPAPNMTDEGHTMSSDMSGPVRIKLFAFFYVKLIILSI